MTSDRPVDHIGNAGLAPLTSGYHSRSFAQAGVRVRSSKSGDRPLSLRERLPQTDDSDVE